MALNLKNSNVDIVSDKGGGLQLTTSSNVAVATAVDVSVREVLMVGTLANASVVKVNIGGAASATKGIPLPISLGTVAAVNPLRLGVASLTALQFYAAEDGDKVDLVWRN